MSEYKENNFDDKRFSLIDVSFEDVSLYDSPRHDSFLYLSEVHFLDRKYIDSIRGEKERQLTLSPEVLELEKTKANKKYNLRESLAWDSAFLAGDGLLEPEELSDMMDGANIGESTDTLPVIEEDLLRRSTDSVSTLATDCSTIATVEDDLFGDIRASIQKSCKSRSKMTVSQSKLGPGVDESKVSKSSEKAETASQNKLIKKAAPGLKKPNVTIKGSGKMANQLPPSGPPLKLASRNEKAASTLSKPPKMIGRPSATLATAATAKVDKDDAKNLTTHSDNAKARGAKSPGIGVSQNKVAKPMLLVKSSLRSSVATKKQLTPSSIDSLESLSSGSSSSHSLNTAKRKINPKTSSTGPSVPNTLRTASSFKNQPTGARTSPHLKPVTKLSSNTSPASSISEWSLESSPPTSNLNKTINSSRPSPTSGDTSKTLDSRTNPTDKFSVGHVAEVTGLSSECEKRVPTGSGALVHPDSIKPTGLRMPSPRLGFFDGVKSLRQSHSIVTYKLARVGFNVNSSEGSNKAKPGNLQQARSVGVKETKTGVQRKISVPQPPKSFLPLQESANAGQNVSKASGNGKPRLGISQKVQTRKSPNLKAEKNTPKECDTAVIKPNFSNVETTGCQKDSENCVDEKENTSSENCVDSFAQEVRLLDIHSEI